MKVIKGDACKLASVVYSSVIDVWSPTLNVFYSRVLYPQIEVDIVCFQGKALEKTQYVNES